MINRRAKNIIVPKHQESMMQLFENRDLETGNYEILSIPTEDLKLLLLEYGFFETINQELQMFIDDYEEEEITEVNDIQKLKSIVEKFDPTFPVVEYYKRLIIKLSEYALEFKTGIFFYF